MKKYIFFLLLPIFLGGCEKTYDNIINGEIDYPPQLSGLNAPDTVIVGNPKSVILMSVVSSDPNGRSDIKDVYFITYKPDGTLSGVKTSLLDDGNFDKNGDEKAGDGIFSILIEVTPQNTKGTYRFDFQAIDLGGNLSNIISHKIVVQ